MMMNQVDSSSFDYDKDDDKNPKRMISRWSQQVQDQDKIKINFKFQEITSRRIKIQEKMTSQGKY